MTHDKIEGKFGVGGVILGPAGLERNPILGQGRWVEGQEHEEVVLLQCVRLGPWPTPGQSQSGHRSAHATPSPTHGGVYHCDTLVAAPVAVLRFPAQAFRAALAADVMFRNTWMDHLADDLLKSRARCERLGLKNAKHRIVHYVESEGADGIVTLSPSRKAWAFDLGLRGCWSSLPVLPKRTALSSIKGMRRAVRISGLATYTENPPLAKEAKSPHRKSPTAACYSSILE
jgi:hypothetical protein